MRGLAKREGQVHLFNLLNFYKPDVFSLLETHTNVAASLVFIRRIDPEWKGAFVLGTGAAGGIMLCWRPASVKVSVLRSNHQIFHCLDTFSSKTWLFSFVYASTISQNRNWLWYELGFFTPNFPWIICVDFNCIINPEDKSGGRPFHVSYSVSTLRNFISKAELIDVGFSGNNFTWCNNHHASARILVRLD